MKLEHAKTIFTQELSKINSKILPIKWDVSIKEDRCIVAAIKVSLLNHSFLDSEEIKSIEKAYKDRKDQGANKAIKDLIRRRLYGSLINIKDTLDESFRELRDI